MNETPELTKTNPLAPLAETVTRLEAIGITKSYWRGFWPRRNVLQAGMREYRRNRVLWALLVVASGVHRHGHHDYG